MISRRAFVAFLGALAGCTTGRTRAVPVPVPLVYDDNGGLFITASVNGQAPIRLILDTGASRSTLATDYVRALGLPIRAGDPVEGSAGVVEAGLALATLEVPGLGAGTVDFVVYAFGSYDPRCAGILGSDFLRRAPFQIRYGGPALLWDAEAPADRIPMPLDNGIPRVTASVNGTPLPLRIDTGAAFPPGADAYLNLTISQAQQVGLTATPEKIFTATGTGDAVLELPVHRLHSLQIASRRLDNAWAIVQPRVGYFARPDAVGFLGNSVLDKLDPYFDYASGTFAIGA